MQPAGRFVAVAQLCLPTNHYTGVKLLIGSKVLCMFYVAFCTPEGRGGGKGGSANFKTKHTEPKKSLQPCTGTLG